MNYKLIFLDIDGVLNNNTLIGKIFAKTHKTVYPIPFDEKCLENLQSIVFQTNSKLVISSSWRYQQNEMKRLMPKLKEYHLDNKVIGITPDLSCYLPETKTHEREYLNYLKTVISPEAVKDSEEHYAKRMEIAKNVDESKYIPLVLNLSKDLDLNPDEVELLLQDIAPYNLGPEDITGLPTDIKHCRRGLEIQAFLKSFPNKSFLQEVPKKYLFKPFLNSIDLNAKIDKFVILDDDSDMGQLLPHLVHCKTDFGLTKEKAAETIQMLNSKTHTLRDEEER